MATFRMAILVALAVASAVPCGAQACTQSLAVNIGVTEAAQCAYVFSTATGEDGKCPSLGQAMRQWLSEHEASAPAPIAHYAFEDDLVDSTAHGRDGQGYGTVGFGEGRCGRAASFDGSSKVVVDAFRNFAWGSRFSVSVWFRRTGSPSTYQGIVNNGYYTTGSWEVRMGREFGGQMLGGGVGTANDVTTWDYINLRAARDVWHHVAMTYDGAALVFYLDGQPQSGDSDCCQGDILIKDTPVTIGQAGEGMSAEYFVGQIDEVKIYDSALSADDVGKLYNSPCSCGY